VYKVGNEFKKEIKLGGCIDHNCGAKEVKSINRVNADFKFRGRVYLVKKCIITMLILTMMYCGTMSFAGTPTGKFSDIDKNHWAISFIDSLKESNIVAGYPDGTFRPGANVKINEFIAMTVKALGFYYEAPADDWAKPYIDKALALKLIDAGQFNTYGKEINREQMASISVNALVLSELRPSTDDDVFICNEIRDFHKISDAYKQNALDSYKLGMTSGYPDGTFRPLNLSTRAEAATLISKLIDSSLRVAPNYEFRTMLKDWFWVQGSKDNDWWWSSIDYTHASTPGKLKFANDLYNQAELQLLEDEFVMPVHKGINVHELYEFGKFVNELTHDPSLTTFYNFGFAETGFAFDGYASKETFIDIYKNNVHEVEQTGVLAEKADFIFNVMGSEYPKYPYYLSIEKSAFDRQKVIVEKMMTYLFVNDTQKVMSAITDAFYSKDYLNVTFNANSRNVSVASGDLRVVIQFSIKH
jgi:hypothetical protein